jgi:hypothetical protein
LTPDELLATFATSTDVDASTTEKGRATAASAKKVTASRTPRLAPGAAQAG